MANEWITIIGALGGVAVGGGLAFLKDWMQYNRQLDDEVRKLRRAKMEELHFSIYELDSIATETLHEILRFQETKIPIADAYPTLIQKNKELMQKAAKAESLQAIYASELGSALKDLVRKVMNFTMDWREFISSDQPLDKFDKTLIDIGDTFDLVRDQVLELIHKDLKMDSHNN